MASASFATLKTELDEACAFLRSFTLGQQGFTKRDGADGIERVNKLCDRLVKLFASGPHGKNAAIVVVAARSRVRAAQSRMAVLAKK